MSEIRTYSTPEVPGVEIRVRPDARHGWYRETYVDGKLVHHQPHTGEHLELGPGYAAVCEATVVGTSVLDSSRHPDKAMLRAALGDGITSPTKDPLYALQQSIRTGALGGS